MTGGVVAQPRSRLLTLSMAVAVAVALAAGVVATVDPAYGTARPATTHNLIVCPQAQPQPCPPPCAASASALCPPPCLASARATPICPPPPPPCTKQCPRLFLTQADAGRTVGVTRGTAIVVRLHGTPQFLWTAPQSSNTSVLAPQGSSADPTTGNAQGRFIASGAGSAQITAIQEPRCALNTPPCLAPDRSFAVTVNVS
jgi:hypothetical protein